MSLKDTAYEMRRAQDVFRFAAMEALRDDGQVFACDTSANGKNRRAYTLRELDALLIEAGLRVRDRSAAAMPRVVTVAVAVS